MLYQKADPNSFGLTVFQTEWIGKCHRVTGTDSYFMKTTVASIRHLGVLPHAHQGKIS
ncbi:hypothetical protein ACIQYG_22035 [Peribacillus sp. NPDC096622]|uniref:hypothetical protein n=1 Tax=Peribacillus sp. NPDC096622 TaxID=3364396 RepID=UPI00380E2295